MYCSVCGSRVPEGRTACGACGAQAARAPRTLNVTGSVRLEPSYAGPDAVGACHRCGFQGQGMSYFSRGSNVAALVVLTVITMGLMGAGGIGYWLLRREQRICPRCGARWLGEGALMPLGAGGGAPPARMGAADTVMVPPESSKRGWSIFWFLFAAVMMMIGIGEGVAVPVLIGAMAAGGGWMLHQGARREREARREAILNSLQLPVLQLAARKQGQLTVTEVAAEMGWTMARAEKVLNSLDDGLRVSSDVTDEGVIVYYFRELMHAPGRLSQPSAPPQLQ